MKRRDHGRLFVAAGATVAAWFALSEILVPALIRSAYRGESIGLLNGLITGREVHPVEAYLSSWSALSIRITVGIVGLAAVVLLVRRLDARDERWYRQIGVVRSDPQASRDVLALILGSIAVVLGILLRIQASWKHFPLDIDERLLAVNLFTRDLPGFFEPLALAQSAPPLFLVATGAIVAGDPEIIAAKLRFLPMLAGCASVPLLWATANRILSVRAAVLATLLFGLGPLPVYYSYFFKPYASDAFFTIGLVAIALWAVQRSFNVVRWLILGAAGAVAILASSSSVFVLTGIGAFVLLSQWASWGRRVLVAVILAAVWGSVLVFLFESSHSELADASSPAAIYMHDSRSWFLRQNFGETSLRFASGVSSTLLGFGNRVWLGLLCSALALVGIASLARRDVGKALLVGVPVAAVIAAAWFERYPLATPRLVLFLAPLTAVAIAAGFGAILAPFHRRLQTLVWMAACLSLVFSAMPGLGSPKPIGQSGVGRRAIVRQLQDDQSKRVIYLPSGAALQWLIDGTAWDGQDTAVASRIIPMIDLTGEATLFRRMWWVDPPVPVPDSSLRAIAHGHVLIVGRSNDWLPSRAQRPGRDWGAREAIRIKGAAKPCLDLLLFGMAPVEIEVLEKAVEELGGEFRPGLGGDVAHIDRVCFGP